LALGNDLRRSKGFRTISFDLSRREIVFTPFGSRVRVRNLLRSADALVRVFLYPFWERLGEGALQFSHSLWERVRVRVYAETNSPYSSR